MSIVHLCGALRPAALALALALTAAACGDDAAGPTPDTADVQAPSDLDDASPDDADAASPDAASPDALVPDGTIIEDTFVPPPDREPGERRDRSLPCDPTDPTLCLLPWPSNAFTALDPATPTGLRVAVDPASAPAGEDISGLVRADGFSRVSPSVTAFDRPLDPTLDPAASVLLLVTEPGAAFATPVPLWCAAHAAADPPSGTLVIYPSRPLAPASEHLVVVLDSLTFADGTHPQADRATRVAVGASSPGDPAEYSHASYFGPAREALAAHGVNPYRVARLWDFTTRSAADPRRDAQALRAAFIAAVDAGATAVHLDEVTIPPAGGPIAVIVRGRLTGLPDFLDADARLARDAAGAPTPTGTTEALFRVVVPAGAGDYRVVMYAHGTGGDVRDDAFDDLFADFGAAKVGLEIEGWTEATLGVTFSDFMTPIVGAERVANRSLHAYAGGAAVLHALAGPLGDVLAIETLHGNANPAAGRRPDTAVPLWAGGSLGGTVGLVFSHLEPKIRGGLLNVPGAGLTHWLPRASLYALIEAALVGRFPTPPEMNLVVAMSQLAFDPMDGANWVDARADRPPFLVQESIGDPVLPNVGSDMVAASLGAVHLGAVLHPVAGVTPAAEALGTSAFTQFKVPEDPAESPLAVHGFAARDGVAGRAARQQIIAFMMSLWTDTPRATVPELCLTNTPPGSCDFSAAP